VKYLVEEASARRAGTEFAFPPESRVYEAATSAVEMLRAALEAVKSTSDVADDEQRKARLLHARATYEDAIREFNEAAREALDPRRPKVRWRATSRA
jgi:hypothetical protein